MPIPLEDISAGRVAYRRAQRYEHYNPRPLVGLLLIGLWICFAVWRPIAQAFKIGHFTSALGCLAFAILVLLFDARQRSSLKKTYQGDLALLARLHQQYGPEIDAMVKKKLSLKDRFKLYWQE